MPTPSGRHHVDTQLLSADADEIDQRTRPLGAVRRGMRNAAACPTPSHTACPTFKRLLIVAVAGVLERQQQAHALAPSGSAAKGRRVA